MRLRLQEENFFKSLALYDPDEFGLSECCIIATTAREMGYEGLQVDFDMHTGIYLAVWGEIEFAIDPAGQVIADLFDKSTSKRTGETFKKQLLSLLPIEIELTKIPF